MYLKRSNYTGVYHLGKANRSSFGVTIERFYCTVGLFRMDWNILRRMMSCNWEADLQHPVLHMSVYLVKLGMLIT